MKVNSSERPHKFYFFQNPRNKTRTVVRFCQNVVQNDNGKGFDYDEYEIEIEKTEQVEAYIQSHYEELLAEASGGPSAVQKLYAYFDYLSMMSDINIPIEEGEMDG